ncbi:MAG: tape measure protein [Paludibacteraceae bacterium]
MLEQCKVVFGGDVAAMEDLYGKIAEYGKNIVYDKAGLLEAQKTMMSFGISGEKAFSTLQNIGDIAMGDSGKMQSLALAFSQTTSTGKLMGQDLMQMINAGFNPLQVISDKTGKSMATLKDGADLGRDALASLPINKFQEVCMFLLQNKLPLHSIF